MCIVATIKNPMIALLKIRIISYVTLVRLSCQWITLQVVGQPITAVPAYTHVHMRSILHVSCLILCVVVPCVY